MEAIIEIVFYSILYLVLLTAYIGSISDIIPKYLLKVTYNTEDKLGRGLKKMVYPDGRAVVYEPHPSIRKYINKYLLFTVNGYKYIQSKIGDGVRSYTADIVCFDNRNRIIDALEIHESVGTSLGNSARLHHKTSHVAYILTSVNGISLQTKYMTVKLFYLPIYLGVFTVATFTQFVLSVFTMNKISMLLDNGPLINTGYAFFILPSIAIAALCLCVTLAMRGRKGVKVVLK